MFFSSTSLQNVKFVRADTYPNLSSAPLILKFESADGFGEFTVHTENVKLSVALAKAINDVIIQFQSEEPPQPIDDGSCDPLYGQRMDSADMGEI